jgi:hypothetical protein
MTSGQKLDEEFVAAVIAIFAKAARETLEAGVPIFGHDDGIDVMVRPDGSRFEIRYIPNATGENHYQIIRQINRTAA